VNRKHALVISLAVGVAAIAGTLAATQTVKLGRHAAARATTPSSLIAQRKHALDRTAVALRKALKQRPPKLPALPARAPAVASAPVGYAPATSGAQRVVYVRPAPIIRHVHRPGGGEGGDGHESDGGSQSGGGGGVDD
jgi:hypothetical protein